MDVCKKLVKLTVRAFYEPKDVILIDILMENPGMDLDQLATALCLANKETQKLYGKLQQDKIIKSINRLEEYHEPGQELVREGHKRKATRSYFYIDYPHVVNLIKYKMVTIENSIKQQEETERTLLPFKCPHCDKEYSALDCFMLAKSIEGVFLCEVCSTELVAEEAQTNETHEKYIRFKQDSKQIIDLLKLTDQIIIPSSKPVLPEPGQPRIKNEREVQILQPTEPTNNVLVEFEQVKEEQQTNDLDDYYANLQSKQVELQDLGLKRPLEQDSEDDDDFEDV
ncbi:hypothetical protein EDD86DRAFT_206899, partial [Gorgonomyces haynaldii]